MSQAYRTLTISMAYGPPKIIQTSIAQFYRTTQVPTEHLIVDQCWPLDREEMEHVFGYLAREYGCKVVRPGRNLGLAKGFNWALEQVPFPDNGGVIGYDPDSWPVTPGWDRAMCDAFVRYPWASWFSLWHPHAERELLAEGRGQVLENDASLVKAKSAVMNSVCMFRRGWLRACGGLYEAHHYYGGLEVHMWPKLVEHKTQWLFLKNYREEFWPYPEMIDVNYRAWKWATCHLGEKQIEFGEWLKLKGLIK